MENLAQVTMKWRRGSDCVAPEEYSGVVCPQLPPHVTALEPPAQPQSHTGSRDMIYGGFDGGFSGIMLAACWNVPGGLCGRLLFNAFQHLQA